MKHEKVQEVCTVETTLRLSDMKLKNRHWYNIGKQYNRASFELRVIVDTGLRFEVWGQDGLLSREHDESTYDPAFSRLVLAATDDGIVRVRWQNIEDHTVRDEPRSVYGITARG